VFAVLSWYHGGELLQAVYINLEPDTTGAGGFCIGVENAAAAAYRKIHFDEHIAECTGGYAAAFSLPFTLFGADGGMALQLVDVNDDRRLDALLGWRPPSSGRLLADEQGAGRSEDEKPGTSPLWYSGVYLNQGKQWCVASESVPTNQYRRRNFPNYNGNSCVLVPREVSPEYLAMGIAGGFLCTVLLGFIVVIVQIRRSSAVAAADVSNASTTQKSASNGAGSMEGSTTDQKEEALGLTTDEKGVPLLLCRSRFSSTNEGGDRPKATYFPLVMAIVTVVDIGFDTSLCFQLSTEPNVTLLFNASVGLLFLPLLANAFVLGHFIASESENPRFFAWCSKNIRMASFIFVLALSKFDNMRLLYCGTFAWSGFSAPISTHSRNRILAWAIVGNLLEDLPQIGVIVALATITGSFNFVTFSCLGLSVFFLLYSLMVRFIACILLARQDLYYAEDLHEKPVTPVLEKGPRPALTSLDCVVRRRDVHDEEGDLADFNDNVLEAAGGELPPPPRMSPLEAIVNSRERQSDRGIGKHRLSAGMSPRSGSLRSEFSTNPV
jgi:hypothetical protein